MLRIIVTSLLIMSVAIQPAIPTALPRVIPSRSKTLQMIDGDNSEQRLYLERCTQSSLYESCIFAIDDDINQEAWSNECATTTADIRPWFEARLENPGYITKVQLYGLQRVIDRGVDALTDFQLIAGDHVCIRYRSYSSFLNKTFSCDTFADHIRIQSNLEHSVLALCEVMVFGKTVRMNREMNGTTPLKAKICMMSSAFDANRCHLAMDNALLQDAGKGHCAMTDPERTPWWEVKLEVPSIVREIRIYNRIDCCQDQLNNFEAFVNGQLCLKFDQHSSFSVKDFSCRRFGDRVRIVDARSGEKNVLTLCEVQFFGFPAEFVSFTNNKYLGCFHEKKRNRDLQSLAAINHMNMEKCERICRRRKKPFFGMQLGKQCWCSERYGLYGQADEDACWMMCDNGAHQACGAKLHNSVFEINEFVADGQ